MRSLPIKVRDLLFVVPSLKDCNIMCGYQDTSCAMLSTQSAEIFFFHRNSLQLFNRSLMNSVHLPLRFRWWSDLIRLVLSWREPLRLWQYLQQVGGPETQAPILHFPRLLSKQDTAYGTPLFALTGLFYGVADVLLKERGIAIRNTDFIVEVVNNSVLRFPGL